VVFDAVSALKARSFDVLIVDTAGRLHTKSNLMEELKKVKRILARELPGAPHETLLVLDGNTGQNALVQAKMFNEAVGITGIVLTKLDGTSRGGIVFAIAKELEIPVKFIGIGEAVEDLRSFDPREFVDALL
jgi:fused signal recognition particle receptor